MAETASSLLLPAPISIDPHMKLKNRFLGFVSCLWATALFLPPISHCKSANHQQRTPPQDSIGQGESFRRGLSALKENRLEAALAELTAAEREDAKDPRIHNFRGIVLARLGQSTEAAAEYQEAIRLDPLMEDAYRNLGHLEWTEHNLERARAALLRAVGLSPKDSFAHYYLGRVQLDGRFYAEAFRELELSDVPWPGEPGFLIEAAEGYLALGRQEDARRTLHQLASLPLADAPAVRVASPFKGRVEASTNIEIKPVDGSANPYLALGGIVAAGLDGPILWTELVKCQNNLPSTGTVPIETVRVCVNRYLVPELGIIPNDWPIVALTLQSQSHHLREGQSLTLSVPPEHVIVLLGKYAVPR